MNTLKEKMRSWTMWLALAALVIYVTGFFGIDISEQVNGLMNVLLPVFVGFGIVNNPNGRENL